MRVNLVDIVYGLEAQSDEHLFYINRNSGGVTHISVRFLQMAQYGDEFKGMGKWEEAEFHAAKELLQAPDDYILLPNMPSVQDMMIQFAMTIEDVELQSELLQTVQDTGMFRPFRSLLQSHELLDEWYGFREEVYIEVARAFCEKHGLNYKQRT